MKTGVLECETKMHPGFHKVKKVFFVCVAALSMWIHVGQLLNAWISSHSGTKKSHAKQGISVQRLSVRKYEEIQKHNNENNIASLKFLSFSL